MRALVLTKIFPNRAEPTSSPFNRQQFAALSRFCEVDVLATIPWFPGARGFARWSRAGRLGDVPSFERIDNLSVHHPRYAYVPRAGLSIAGPLYAASVATRVLPYRGQVDVLLGSWAYPDGWAAVTLARWLGVPAVVKVHGSDVNVLADDPGAERRLRWTLSHADRVVTVSRALAERVTSLGAAWTRVHVVPNGVDRGLFHPSSRRSSRERLGLGKRPAVLYVGHLLPDKGVLELVRALAGLDAELWLVGAGPAEAACRRLARELGTCLRLFGERPHAEIPEYLAAAEVLALPSHAEGSPNVVAEALACGRRVVATRVGGIPELVSSELLGELVPPRDPDALRAALRAALVRPESPRAVARAADISSWSDSARRLYEVLLDATTEHREAVAA